MVKIRLKRVGAKKAPFYHIVVADSRTSRDGKVIDQVGTYDPMTTPSTIVLDEENHTFIIPVHPNPNVHDKIYSRLGNTSNIKLLPPLDYPNLVYLMENAKLILTDSGGIQEEAPSFACPTLVMRYETERKEGIDAGVSKLVGADYEKITAESERILSGTKAETRLSVKNPYGDGMASVRIVDIIEDYFSE